MCVLVGNWADLQGEKPEQDKIKDTTKTVCIRASESVEFKSTWRFIGLR